VTSRDRTSAKRKKERKKDEPERLHSRPSPGTPKERRELLQLRQHTPASKATELSLVLPLLERPVLQILPPEIQGRSSLPHSKTQVLPFQPSSLEEAPEPELAGRGSKASRPRRNRTTLGAVASEQGRRRRRTTKDEVERRRRLLLVAWCCFEEWRWWGWRSGKEEEGSWTRMTTRDGERFVVAEVGRVAGS